MSDDLRARIAKKLHTMYANTDFIDRAWDDLHPMTQEKWLRDADAVIAELGLTREFMATCAEWNGGGQVRRTLKHAEQDVFDAANYKPYPVDDPHKPVTAHIETRYVTDWKADE